MKNIHLNGDFEIEEIFESYRKEIYENILTSIKENYLNSEIKEVKVVKISTISKDYNINLSRDRFIDSLNKCIAFFEEIEYYELCQECVNIINDIKNKQKSSL